MLNKKSVLTILLIFILAILMQTNLLFARDSAIQPLPKGVSIFQLDNGMKVLLVENPALPMIGVNVVVKVGSAYEDFATSGMSHYLEHLLFNGTTSRTQKQLYDDVDRIGGYNNANTAEFCTNYMMVTPAEKIDEGMEIQADMLFHSIMPQEKFDKEKGIVLEEISKSLVDAREQMERNVTSILYSGHALSLPTLGTYSTIESMKREDVYNFYKNYYVPNNMILNVIGSFKTKDMLEKIKKIYGAASPGTVSLKETPEWSTGLQSRPASALNQERVFHRFYDGNETSCQFYYELPPVQSTEFFELIDIVLKKSEDDIQNSIKAEFGDGVSSVKLGTRPSPVTNYFTVTVALKSEVDFNKLAKSVSAKLAALDFALAEETVKAEVSKARTSFLQNIEKPHMFGIYNATEFAVNGIEAVLASYNGDLFFQAAKQLTTVKFAADPIIIIQHPSETAAEETVETASDTKLFSDKAAGQTFIFKQNSNSNLLAVHFLVKHKAYFESKYGKNAGKILHDCLGQRLDSDENKNMSSQFGLTYVVNDNPYIPMDDIYLHPDFGYVRAEGLADDLPAAIDYLISQMKGFVPTEAEFAKALQGSKRASAMMRMGGGQTKDMFDEAYKSLLYEPALYPEGAAELTYENLLAFANEYFQPANMIVSAVSPVSPDSLKNLFSKFSSEPVKDEPQVYKLTLKLHDKEITEDKQGDGKRSYLYWGFTKQIDPADEAAISALSLILSDKIIFDVREKQGMAYHMGAGIEQLNDRAAFYINMGTRPQNVDVLLPQFPGFFSMKMLDTVTEDDLQKSCNMYLGRMMLRRLSSINQAFYLANSLYFNGDINRDKTFFEKLKKVKLQDVKQVAKKYMKVENPISVIVR